MALSNNERVGKGLEALKRGLGPYVLREMKRHYGDRLETQLEDMLYKEQLDHFRQGGGTDEAFLEAVDVDALLKIMRVHYPQVFFDKLGHDPRSYANELTGVRHRWAHPRSSTTFTTESAARALKTMMLLLKAVGANQEVEEVDDHLHAVRRDTVRRGNPYKIIRSLGSGGMGEVYLARDNDLDRDVAIKYLDSKYAKNPEFVERFEREAKSAARLSHPNIVSVYDRSRTEEHYIVMEYVPGVTLKDYIQHNGRLPAKTAAEVAAQIAAALDAAHSRGVIHRDIKPQNVLITETGSVKVTDFGIARAASYPTITPTGQVLGSEHYLSPEQAMGETATSRSDLYSLGIVLYEMLTGELPYTAETPMGVTMKHVNGQLRPPREINPEIPESINALTVRLLSKSPEDRHRSAAELIEDLEKKIIDGKDPATAGTEPLSERKTAVMDPYGNKQTPAEIVVSPDPGEHFQTIGQALRKVRPGGRIRVRPGVYPESLVIDKPVEIIGERGPEASTVIESTEGPCLSISAGRVTIKGLVLRRLEDTEEQGAEYSTAVTISAEQVTIEDCDITSAAGDCVIVHGSKADPTIRGCEIHDGQANGVFIYANGRGDVEDCEIYGNVSSGVAIKTGANPTIRRCKIYGGEANGVFVRDNGRGLVEGCNIFGNAYAGVTIAADAYLYLRRCTITGNGYQGVWAKSGSTVTHENCNLEGNARGSWKTEDGAKVYKV